MVQRNTTRRDATQRDATRRDATQHIITTHNATDLIEEFMEATIRFDLELPVADRAAQLFRRVSDLNLLHGVIRRTEKHLRFIRNVRVDTQ